MATSFDFSFQIGAQSDGTDALTGDDVTITATDDDGVISVGDEVTITGLNSIVSTYSGIAEGGTAYYLGSATFGDEVGYVFTSDGNLDASDDVLVLFDDSADEFTELLAVRAFAQDTSSVTLSSDPACFAADTLISTPDGLVAVQDLQIGDPILSACGRVLPVKWVGRQTIVTRFQPPERLSPVRIAAGALGAGLPHADLTVTADHALLLDGVLCQAGTLVNGTTITRVALSHLPLRFTVYHVETAEHAVILANGCPAETFVDHVSRRVFDNYGQYVALFGDDPRIPEQPLPRAQNARQLPRSLRHRLGLTAAA